MMYVLNYYMGTTTLVDYEENLPIVNTNAIPLTDSIQLMLAQVYAAVKEEDTEKDDETLG